MKKIIQTNLNIGDKADEALQEIRYTFGDKIAKQFRKNLSKISGYRSGYTKDGHNIFPFWEIKIGKKWVDFVTSSSLI